MIRILTIIFVLVVIFTSAVYIGFVEVIIEKVVMINNDFLPYINMEIRFVFFALVVWIMLALGKSFIK